MHTKDCADARNACGPHSAGFGAEAPNLSGVMEFESGGACVDLPRRLTPRLGVD